MTVNPHTRPLAYSRLETDRELRARFSKATITATNPTGDSVSPNVFGSMLDELVWQHAKIQRRIVWVDTL